MDHSSFSSESDALKLSSLRGLTREMEKVGLAVVKLAASAVGFDNPTGICSYMWLNNGCGDDDVSGGLYPFVVGLQYQIRQQRYSLQTDSGQVMVSAGVDSVLVTIGDIAQVEMGMGLRPDPVLRV